MGSGRAIWPVLIPRKLDVKDRVWRGNTSGVVAQAHAGLVVVVVVVVGLVGMG
jgi:hypothetical protein